jgi:hypothetical protein
MPKLEIRFDRIDNQVVLYRRQQPLEGQPWVRLWDSGVIHFDPPLFGQQWQVDLTHNYLPYTAISIKLELYNVPLGGSGVNPAHVKFQVLRNGQPITPPIEFKKPNDEPLTNPKLVHTWEQTFSMVAEGT